MLGDSIKSALLANDGALLREITVPKANGAAPLQRAAECTVDPAQAVANVERFIKRFVVLPEATYLPISLWAISTHTAQRFECFPYLALLSPAKRCGKT